ncbi:probable nucleolar protein 12 at C-terminar half [Coccomyxa sp. Obi]|nr:probable nucleolar protein 12 at C-terminar half [Coccomyxa sp. Obi]
MSLFQGLFPTTSGPTSTLFSEDSKYKRQEHERDIAIKQAVAPSTVVDKKKRKSTEEGTTQPKTASTGASEQPVKSSSSVGCCQIGCANRLFRDYDGLKATSELMHLFHGLVDLSTPAASTLNEERLVVIVKQLTLASTLQVKKKAKAKNTKVEQPPGNTETSLQSGPAAAEPLESGSSIHPSPHKAKKEKPKRDKKLGTASAPSAAGKSGSPIVHSKAIKPPKAGSLAQAHAGTEADVSKEGQTHEAAVASRKAVGKEEEDASALDTVEDEPATGLEGADGVKQGGPAKRRRTEEEKAERLRRTIFVGNLPVKVKAKLIKQAFSQYGTVESVRLRSLPLKDDGKLPRRAAVAAGALDEAGSANAYVVFSSGVSAVHALAHNMREFEGRHIRVDRAAAVSKGIEGGGTQVLYDSARSIFVGNLPFDTKASTYFHSFDEELIEMFGDGKGGPGSVTAVRVVRDAKTSVGKGIAFVEFSGRPAARMAMSADGRVLRGRPIRVTRVAKSGAAAAAAAEASAAGGSRLRTPFSRGVKVGPNIGPGPRKGAKSGQEKGTPRPGSQAAWQGMRTKGQKKIVRGFAVKEREGPGAAAAGVASKGAPRNAADGKPKGKRPSVAARKQNLLSNKKQKRS